MLQDVGGFGWRTSNLVATASRLATAHPHTPRKHAQEGAEQDGDDATAAEVTGAR